MAIPSAALGAFDGRPSLFEEATFDKLVAAVAMADCLSTPDITTSRLMPPTSPLQSAMFPWPRFNFGGANAVDAAHRIEDDSTNR